MPLTPGSAIDSIATILSDLPGPRGKLDVLLFVLGEIVRPELSETLSLDEDNVFELLGRAKTASFVSYVLRSPEFHRGNCRHVREIEKKLATGELSEPPEGYDEEEAMEIGCVTCSLEAMLTRWGEGTYVYPPNLTDSEIARADVEFEMDFLPNRDSVADKNLREFVGGFLEEFDREGEAIRMGEEEEDGDPKLA